MMKKLTLLALVLAAPTATLAGDLAAGAWQLRGGTGLGYSTTTTKIDSTGEKITQREFSLRADAAYYLTPLVGLGLSLAHDDSTTEYPDGSEDDVTSTSIGPLLALNLPVAPNVAIFGDLFVGYTETEVGGFTFSGYGGGIDAGVRYFFTRNVAADVGLQYSVAEVEGTVFDQTETLSLGSFRIFVGLSVFLDNPARAAAAP